MATFFGKRVLAPPVIYNPGAQTITVGGLKMRATYLVAQLRKAGLID
jgi:hypothetical protein